MHCTMRFRYREFRFGESVTAATVSRKVTHRAFQALHYLHAVQALQKLQALQTLQALG